MAITLSQLCANTKETYGMKLLAGKNGLDNYVRWVHMVEDRQVPDFLHGNELVFTTGISQHGSAWLFQFVKNLREHNAVGLILNIGPYISSIPSKVVVYCEENDFPIFTVPWEVHLIDVTYDFCHRIVASEENELGLAAAFKNLIFTPENKESYVRVLERRGFRKDSEYTVIVSQMERNGKIETADSWHKVKLMLRRVLGKRSMPLCVFMQENNLVIILQKCNTKSAKKLANQLFQNINQHLEDTAVYMGISNVGDGYSGVVVSYKEAISALQVSKIKKNQIQLYKDIGVYKLLLGVEDYNILRDFMTSNLGLLINYDEENNTNLMQILECYLKNDSSSLEVANSMGVHRNTINYKIKLIRDILKTNLNGEVKVNLSLAFEIYKLINI